MPQNNKKIRIIYFVLLTLLLIGIVPLVVTGWFLSNRSAEELRAVEGRYQTQLVQDKARQIEMFGQRYGDLIAGIGKGFEFAQNMSLLSSPATQQRLGQILKENPNLLAIYVKPVNGEPLSVYRTESINEQELGAFSTEVISKLGEKKLVVARPENLTFKGENIMTIAVPVAEKEAVTAAVVGVVALREFAAIMAETKPQSEKELLEAGLPIIFVVDEKGRAVYHPDSQIAGSQKTLGNLKIVEEWQQSNRQIQSALVPFNAEYDGRNYAMIGAYSTAAINKEMNFGVIAMQDESRALASVGEMRKQTWLISLALAFVASIVGWIFARQLTKPVSTLVSAAQKIGAGDLSVRIQENKVEELNALGLTFNSMSESLAQNIANLAKAAEENRELFVGTVKALAAAIDGKDRYTRGHSERVSRISVAIGEKMKLGKDDLEKLRISALLHDVGKIAVNDAILNKPGALTDDEFEIMKSHAQKGYKIMSQIPAMKDYLPGIQLHHEMLNGAGYPLGLKGDEIPLQAKIISVADTFDAMTTDRPYQKGMNFEDAVNRIKSFVGTRYDGKVVESFVQACSDGNIRTAGVHPNNLQNVNLIESEIVSILT